MGKVVGKVGLNIKSSNLDMKDYERLPRNKDKFPHKSFKLFIMP